MPQLVQIPDECNMAPHLFQLFVLLRKQEQAISWFAFCGQGMEIIDWRQVTQGTVPILNKHSEQTLNAFCKLGMGAFPGINSERRLSTLPTFLRLADKGYFKEVNLATFSQKQLKPQQQRETTFWWPLYSLSPFNFQPIKYWSVNCCTE